MYDTYFNEAGIFYLNGKDGLKNSDKICEAVGEDTLECRTSKSRLSSELMARHALGNDLFF